MYTTSSRVVTLYTALKVVTLKSNTLRNIRITGKGFKNPHPFMLPV